MLNEYLVVLINYRKLRRWLMAMSFQIWSLHTKYTRLNLGTQQGNNGNKWRNVHGFKLFHSSHDPAL